MDESAQRLVLVGMTRQRDPHGARQHRPDPLEQCPAIDARHPDVRHDDVEGTLVAAERERSFATTRERHVPLAAQRAERPFEASQHARLVVDEQDAQPPAAAGIRVLQLHGEVIDLLHPPDEEPDREPGPNAGPGTGMRPTRPRDRRVERPTPSHGPRGVDPGLVDAIGQSNRLLPYSDSRSFACAAARRAIGTRGPEQDT